MARSLFHLWRAARPADLPVTDAELLRRHTDDRDNAAFELLVRRHADTVWTACRRVLPSDSDAEDAFQTAFLLLLRRASSIRGTCFGGWLHRVAVTSALKLKSRQKRAMPLDSHDQAGVSSTDCLEQVETTAIVHRELAALPDRYRLPVVLCDLEGQTHAEAAATLNWPIGSVSGRLSRAHALLRERLTRRGLAPAALPAALVAISPPSRAVQSMHAIGSGSVPISPSVSSLVQGVISAMKTAQLKLAFGIAAVLGGITLTGLATAYALSGSAAPAETPNGLTAPVPPEKPLEGDWIPKKDTDPPPTAFPQVPAIDWKEFKGDSEAILGKRFPLLFGPSAIAIEAGDDTYRRLLKARLYQGTRELWKMRMRIEIGSYQSLELQNLIRLEDDMRGLVLELWQGNRKELASRLEELLVIAKDVVRFTRARAAAGTDPPQSIHLAERHRLEVEAVLWKVLHPK